MIATPKIRVGVGGWVFPPWRGTFYPPGLPQTQELAYASRQVTTIEINGTFYGPQKPTSYRRWHDETPDDFVFSLKGPRVATHRSDLAGAGPIFERFVASGIAELRDKLGPILWQFPPNIRIEEAAFTEFLELLPRHIDGRRLRHVVEFRRSGGVTAAVIEQLRHREVALVAGDDGLDGEPTADFVYLHLRRCAEDEPGGYSAEALDAWAERLREKSAQAACDYFVYFISGAKMRAPAAAQALLRRLTAAA